MSYFEQHNETVPEIMIISNIVVMGEFLLGQHLLISCFLTPVENLASEGKRLLLLIINNALF